MQESVQISKRSLNKLRKRLPKNFIDKVNEMMKEPKHRSTIYRVLSGEIENNQVLEALIEVAEMEQQRIKRLKEKLNFNS